MSYFNADLKLNIVVQATSEVYKTYLEQEVYKTYLEQWEECSPVDAIELRGMLGIIEAELKDVFNNE